MKSGEANTIGGSRIWLKAKVPFRVFGCAFGGFCLEGCNGNLAVRL